MLALEMGNYTVEVTCDEANGLGDLGIRISSIFVIGLGSLLGALLPIWLTRTRHSENKHMKTAFFVVKYFGSGVIIATAFIHLLAPATQALRSPCLTGPITEYAWPEAIPLVTIFLMFFIELLVARKEFRGDGHNHTEVSHLKDFSGYNSTDFLRPDLERGRKQRLSSSNDVSQESIAQSPLFANRKGDQKPNSNSVLTDNGFPHPSGGSEHLNHQREHEHDSDTGLITAQLTSIFILEFGVIFHSIFIGLTLAVAGSEFTILYIVLTFHQAFEGLALGTRLALTPWPTSKKHLPWILGILFGLTTPLAIAIGLGIRTSFRPGSQKTMIINGIFDSVSAGILIYTGLVELMAHEFMFNEDMRKASLRTTLQALACMASGAGVMALLGKWA